MKIALDAMGGDLAPQSPVEGAVKYLLQDNGNNEVVLLGDEKKIKRILDHHLHVKEKIPYSRMHIVHTTQAVEMHDAPANVIKEKPDSSLVKGLKMHKKGEVSAFVSAGSTGAQMAASLLTLGRIKGVSRPALGTIIPSMKGGVLLIDVGANAECKPQQLMQFGLMGALYYEFVSGVKNPKIGLLNIGEEKTKGSELYQEAHILMEQSLSDFVGNIEGRDIVRGKADVVVCDGFVGNVILKFAESVMGMISHSFKMSIGKNLISLIGALMVKRAFHNMKREYSYEEYGGAPLLGVNGISIIGHGSSSPKALMNALLVAQKMVEMELNEHIKEKLLSI